jgi:hypothetical protein
MTSGLLRLRSNPAVERTCAKLARFFSDRPGERPRNTRRSPGYFTYAYDALLSAVPSPQSWLSLRGRLSITPNSPARWNNAVTWEGSFRSVAFAAIHSAGNHRVCRLYGNRP